MTVTTATGLQCHFMPGAGPFDVADDFYFLTPGVTGNVSGANATTPDAAALDILGDIDVQVDMTLDRWAAPPTTGYEVLGKFVPPANQSWLLWLNAQRKIVFRHSADGTAIIDTASTSPIPITRGRLAIRAALDVNDGAGNRVMRFWTAPTIAGPWTQLGLTVTTAGVTTIFNSTATLGVGNVPSSGFHSPPGRFHAARVYADLVMSDVRANPDFTAQAPGTTSFADSAGRTWTINSPATIAGFTWVDISNRLTSSRWTIGRSDELAAFPPGEADLVLKNDDRQLDPTYTAGTWYGKLNPRTPFRLRSISSALRVPGAGGSTASTPDHSSFNVTDLDVRLRLAMDDWTPGGFGSTLIGQYPSAPNLGWVLSVTTTGELTLTWSTNGTATLTRTSTVPTGFINGSDHWIRVTLDVDNGAAGHTVTFYSSSDGVTWDLIGTAVTTAGTTTVFNSTAPLVIGDILTFAGYVRTIELRASIGGAAVTNPEFSSQRPGTTAFRDRCGRAWTLNGTATVLNDTATTSDQFYGFNLDGFVQVSSPPEQGDCVVHLVDMLQVLNESPLPQTALEAEVLADVPAANWRLDETSGTQMADSSGYGRHGFYDNSVLGQESLTIGGGSSVEYPHVGDHRGRWQGGGLPTAAPCSLEAWVKTTRDAAAIKSIIVAQRDTSLGQALWLQIATAAGGSPNGELVIDFFALGTNYKARGSTRLDDDRPHHVVCTIAGNTPADVLLYVDGTLQTKTTVAGTNPGSWPSLLLWTIGNTTDNGYGDYGFDGLIDDVRIYDYVLDPSRIIAHYNAGSDGFDGESTGAAINRALDIVGVPTSMRDIATGDTIAGPANYSSQSAGQYIGGLVESEQGVCFVDHRHAGKIKFRGRYARLTEPRSTTSLWTFTDADAPGNLHYEPDGFECDPGATSGMVNVVDVTWRGGTETVENTASRKQYGPQSRSLTTEAPTPESAASAGNWVTNRYSQPQQRIRGFKLRPDADKRLWAAALDLQVSDRTTVGRHPQQVGSATSSVLTVEGASHTVEGTEWMTEVRTSVAVLGDVAQWDLSTWDVTARWG